MDKDFVDYKTVKGFHPPSQTSHTHEEIPGTITDTPQTLANCTKRKATNILCIWGKK